MKNKDFIDSRRIELTGKMLLGIILLLVLRLWYLQIAKGDEFAELSRKNTIRAIRVEGIRGNILDRNGKLLAKNNPGFNARIFRAGGTESSENWNYVFSVLDIDKNLSDFPLRRHAYLRKDMNLEALAWLSERKAYLPELNIEVYPRRHYPFGGSLAHVVGYTGEIGREELESNRGSGYARGDSIGKAGVEKSLEAHLRGSSGGKQVLVNAYGHHIDILAEKKPSRGGDVKLTIDSRIQRIAEEELGAREGAVVAMDPRNGEILAIASRPSFDPNILAGRLSSSQWSEFLLSAPVFESKAYQSAYPPGSTLKPLVAICGLDDKIIEQHEKLYCPGEYRMGSHVFRCWHRDGHGSFDMLESLVYSCNVYFYKLGGRAGIRRLAEHAGRLGFGTPTGLEVPAEAQGLFPSPEWKRARTGLAWYPGDTVNASIGQGYVLATPLQVAVLYSAIANGGTVYRPRLIHSLLDSAGRTIMESSPEKISSPAFSPETAAFIRNALSEAAARGTGLYARVEGIEVSGKTGTAQNPHGENHAWFAGYAPSGSPEICVVVFLEHAGQGSLAAAPVFSEIVRRVFQEE